MSYKLSHTEHGVGIFSDRKCPIVPAVHLVYLCYDVFYRNIKSLNHRKGFQVQQATLETFQESKCVPELHDAVECLPLTLGMWPLTLIPVAQSVAQVTARSQ